MSTAIAILRPQNMAELEIFADRASKSNLVPLQYKNKPDDILIAVQMGSELGLPPMQSLQNIAIINGRPAVWGDAMPGLVYGSGKCQHIKESIEGDGDKMIATCIAKRVGTDYEVTVTFSVDDAKRAGLWNKQGPWTQYPKRMLQMRARGFALRDSFPDVLRGLISAEEAQDIPPDTFKGTTIDARAEPIPPDPVDTAPPPKATTSPQEAARTFADGLLADIVNAGDENDLHDLAGNAAIQKKRDRLKAAYPEMDQEIAQAFTRRFNDFIVPPVGGTAE